MIRILQPGDEAALEQFLQPHLASSMFLVGNLRAGGLVDRDVHPTGTYAAAFDESGAMVGVAAQFWNGNIITQAPMDWLRPLTRAIFRARGRSVQGILGPADQAYALLHALGLTGEVLQMDSRELLYRLDLRELCVPPALVDGRLTGRRARAADLDLLADWQTAYSVEALHDEETQALREECRESVERGIRQETLWVVEAEGAVVAMSGFNTAIVEAVQIGGVYTPPALRGRGYARAAVAQSLLDARAAGASTAILFTGDDHTAAHKAYTALGFQVIGDYALLIFRRGISVPA